MRATPPSQQSRAVALPSRGGAITGEGGPRVLVPETQIHKVLHYPRARVKTVQGLLTGNG
jgi:hypothetical protein